MNMTEILFSDGAAGGLAAAKAVGQDSALGEAAVFHLALSFGDIRGEGTDERRLAALKLLFSPYPEDVAGEAACQLYASASEAHKRLRERLHAGGLARVWFSGQPDEMCGFYWLMEQLRAWGVFSGVLALWLPDGMGGGWSGAPAEAWRTAGPWTELTREQISAGAAKWRALQSENAPLRANVRGKLQSVSEDFYDGWLERAIDAQEECFQEARLIGTILGQYRLGISDGWLALRLERWIREGRLEAVTAAPEGYPQYHRILKKVG